MVQVFCILTLLVVMMIVTSIIKNKCIWQKRRWLMWCVFTIYALGNLYFTLVSRAPDSGQYLELQPFRSYGRLFKSGPVDKATVTGFAELFLKDTTLLVGIILNILLYYPLGYLLPILFPKLKPKHVIFIGCLCSIATEATQYFLKMGWCETDDVIHNTLGTAIGVWIWHLQSKRLNKQNSNELPKG